jgi:peroxiredoxin Q/BCP
MRTMLSEGSPFPDFQLNDQDGKPVTKADLLGTRTIVYFYPKDDTSGCTKEACEFRDRLPEVEGVQVFGVSPDDEKSHRKFIDKYQLNFRLLADTEQALAKACGVWVEKSMYGKKYMGVERTTFLVGPDGNIQRIWRKVKPEGHAAEVLAALS